MARRLVTKKDAKQIVQLRDQEKCTWFQIAEATGWSPMVVWQHYHRVRPYDKTRPWARRYRIGPGLRFGRLVVISTHSKKRILTSRPRTSAYCWCICDCGTKIVSQHGNANHRAAGPSLA